MTKPYFLYKIRKMEYKDSVYSESSVYAFFASYFFPILRPAFCKSVPQILYNFFYSQWKFNFFSGRLPVVNVDHPLDSKIPFKPSWVTIYLDFVHFWIRMLTFFLRRFGRKAHKHARDFIYSMGDLYAFASDVYKKHLSTTKRPFYIARPRFFVIHMTDPHLFCVPSLHVMVVIHTYLMFKEISIKLGVDEKLKEQWLEMKQGALAISQAILFVKQHSVNCIPAALYAMTRYSPDLFPPEEAQKFTDELFTPVKKPPYFIPRRMHPSYAPKTNLADEDIKEIKTHIMTLYRKFLEEGKKAQFWGEPLVNFLKEMKK